MDSKIQVAFIDESDCCECTSDDTMPCGCESGSCYCDTIDRDWDAYEAGRTPVLGH